MGVFHIFKIVQTVSNRAKLLIYTTIMINNKLQMCFRKDKRKSIQGFWASVPVFALSEVILCYGNKNFHGNILYLNIQVY